MSTKPWIACLVLLAFVPVRSSGAQSVKPARADSSSANNQPRQEGDPVRMVLERYLHGLKFNDTTDFHAAFWPGAKLMFIRRDGSLGQLSQSTWYRGFAEVAGKEEEGNLRITRLQVTGTAASARVVETYATSIYIDYLNLLRIGDRWQIVNKIYTVEPRAKA